MVWTRDFRASSIVVDTGGAASKVIRSITNSSARSQAEITKEIASRSIFADTAIISAIRPMMSFTTLDIPGAIDALGLTGICIHAAAGDEGLAFYGQAQDCSGIKAGSVHDKYLVSEGVVVPRTLSVDHRGNCALTYEVYCAWDGTNDPIIYSQNQALPAIAASPVGRWTMRALTLGGVTVEGKRSLSIDFGSQVSQEGADSELYDSVTSISAIMPQVTVRGVDTAWLNTVTGLVGDKALHADSVFQLQKRGEALASAVHVKLTFNGLITIDTLFDGTPTAPAEATVNVDLTWDGTNAPITSTINTALP